MLCKEAVEVKYIEIQLAFILLLVAKHVFYLVEDCGNILTQKISLLNKKTNRKPSLVVVSLEHKRTESEIFVE